MEQGEGLKQEQVSSPEPKSDNGKKLVRFQGKLSIILSMAEGNDEPKHLTPYYTDNYEDIVDQEAKGRIEKEVNAITDLSGDALKGIRESKLKDIAAEAYNKDVTEVKTYLEQALTDNEPDEIDVVANELDQEAQIEAWDKLPYKIPPEKERRYKALRGLIGNTRAQIVELQNMIEEESKPEKPKEEAQV
jgi:hypothetical protein